MGADYKAPGRHLSPPRPATRCSQREDAVLSIIFDIFVLLFTVSCIWILSHGVPRQQVQSFVHGIFAVVWWGFLRNKGVKGLCQDTLLTTALFPLQWMPCAVAAATTNAISPGTSSWLMLEISLPIQFFALTFFAVLFTVSMVYHYGPQPAGASFSHSMHPHANRSSVSFPDRPSNLSQVCPFCGM